MLLRRACIPCIKWPGEDWKDGCWFDFPAALSPPLLLANSGEDGIVDRVENGDEVDDDSMPAEQGVSGKCGMGLGLGRS